MAATRQRVKFLVDQLSGQVVWLTYYYDSLPIPIFDQSLNVQKFNGLTDFNIWTSYLEFKLFFNASTSKFYSIGNYSEDFKTQFPRVQLQRAQAMAIDHVNAGCEFLYEKYNMSYKGLHNVFSSGNINSDRWINFLQEEHNCSNEEAIKLINFKKEEWSNLEFMIETTRYRAYNKMKATQTLDDVNEVYECTCATLFYSARPALLRLGALAKPF